METSDMSVLNVLPVEERGVQTLSRVETCIQSIGSVHESATVSHSITTDAFKSIVKK
jgi:hypothetical protein